MPFLIGRVKFKFKFFLKGNFNFTLLGRASTLWKAGKTSILNVDTYHTIKNTKG